MNKIQKFYNEIKFPGEYSVESLDYHTPIIVNPYLRLIDKFLSPNLEVLDAGCGSGFITNFFAKKYRDSDFTGVDFSTASINHARYISKTAGLTNTKFVEVDLLSYRVDQQFDLVICQGVLHHIPDYDRALQNLKATVKDNGYFVLGLYHPWGKIAKKYLKINYGCDVLYLDQESNPFEIFFDYQTIKKMLPEFCLIKCYPQFCGSVALPNLINYQNGGLTTYVFKKNN